MAKGERRPLRVRCVPEVQPNLVRHGSRQAEVVSVPKVKLGPSDNGRVIK